MTKSTKTGEPTGARTPSQSLSVAISGRSRDSTAHRIAQSAIEHFIHQGFRGTSVDDIVGRAGLTKPTFYYHFESRLGLLLEILDNSLSSIERAFAREDKLELRPTERLHHLVKAYALEVCDRPELWTIYFAERKEIPSEVLNAWKQRERGMVAVIERTLREGMEFGEILVDHPNVAAHGIMGIAGWLHHWFNATGELNADQLAEEIASLACTSVVRPAPDPAQR